MFFLRTIFAFLIFSSVLVTCKTSEQPNSNTQFFTYYARGHEDISRFSIDLANTAVEKESGIQGFYPPESANVIISNLADVSTKSNNPIIYGNVATDFPLDVIYHGIMLQDFYSDIKMNEHWFTAGYAQNFHFMRNFMKTSDDEMTVLQDTKEAAEKGIQLILHATGRAAFYWLKAEKAKDDPRSAEAFRNVSFFLVGHALHIIQDSFCKGHTRRSDDFKKIVEVCVPKPAEGACAHQIDIEALDDIWKNPVTGRLQRDWNSLTDEAQAAAQVSGGYLLHFAVQLNKIRNDSWSDDVEKPFLSTMKSYLVDPAFYPPLSGFFTYY